MVFYRSMAETFGEVGARDARFAGGGFNAVYPSTRKASVAVRKEVAWSEA
jgi:hypothetical protein